MDAERERWLVDQLAATPPGPELHALVERCRARSMSPVLASAVLEAATRLLAAVEALRLEAVSAVAGPAPADPQEDFSDAEVAVATGCSTRAAQRLVGLARLCVLGPLRVLHAELASGRTSVVHLLMAADEVSGLEPELADRVLAELCAADAAALPAPRFRERLRRAVRRADAAAELRRRERARRRRGVRRWVDADGIGYLQLSGDLDRVTRAWEAICARAEALPVDERSVDARRADVALDLLAGADGPTPSFGRGEVLAVVAADALLPTPAADSRVAELVGVGPVLAGSVRSLARDHVVRRVVIDRATGRVLDTSLASRPRAGRALADRLGDVLAAPLAGPPPTSPGYVPSVALARHVTIRDRRCALPGCSIAAARCDLDHARPYPHGPTTEENLGALCRRHHRLKTRGRWVLRRDGGRTRWRTSTGRIVAGQQEDYRWLLV